MRSVMLFFILSLWLSVTLGAPSPVKAGEAAGTLTVREAGTALYPRQDAETSPMATLEKDEELVPLVEALGRETWYMVRTRNGLVGWVRGADVIVSSETREAFTVKESDTPRWSARSVDGRIYSGTWSVTPGSTPRAASGTWTLSGPDGAMVMRGTWSADKHTTGWNGVWRARIEGREGEYTGSWSADLPHVGKPPFSDLFAAAAKKAIDGLWTGGRQSGRWSIRGAKN